MGIKGGSYFRVKSSEGGPPRAIVYFNKNYRHDPGRDSAMLRPAMEILMSSRREMQGKIASIFVVDAPQGAPAKRGGGFSPAVSLIA